MLITTYPLCCVTYCVTPRKFGVEVNHYDQLIAVLDALIENFGGATKLRGAKATLLVQRESMGGRGLTLSEIARATSMPFESVRRHVERHVALGDLHYVRDPDDDRVTRVVATDADNAAENMLRLANRVSAIK